VLRRSTRLAFNARDIDVSAPDSLPHPCTTCTAQRPGNVDEAARLEALGRAAQHRRAAAMVCANCGEEYLGSSTTERLPRMAEEAAASGVQVDVRAFRAG